MAYRLTRNAEASFVDYITIELAADGWTGIRVEKSFAKVYEGALPCICINSPDRPLRRREIGGNSIFKELRMDIRIFTKSDGIRLDLADWIIEKIINGINYYEYTITGGAVSSKIPKGKITIPIVSDIENRKELVNVENLSQEDRYRHLISFVCRISFT